MPATATQAVLDTPAAEFRLPARRVRTWSAALPEVERIASEIQKQDKHARPIHLQLVQLEASRRMSFTHCSGVRMKRSICFKS